MTGKDKLLEEALAAVKKANYDGIVLLPTGSGKSRLMIEAAKILNPESILYLCDSQDLRDRDFPNELAKWDANYLLPRMELMCYKSAYKLVGKQYSLLLADEFDASLTPKYCKVYKNNKFDKRILVSATLDEAKVKKAKQIAPIIFNKTPKEIIDAKVVNGVKFHFVNFNLTPAENGMYLHYNKEFKSLLNSVKNKDTEQKLDWLKIKRKQFLSKLDSSLQVTKWLIKTLQAHQPNDKILVFCGLSEQANKVCRHAYHSNNDEDWLLDDFDAGRIKLMSVVDKVNRGLNIDSIRNIIFDSTGSSKTKLTQRIGRGQRLEVNEVLNVFFLIPYFMSVWGERKPTIVQQWILDTTKEMDLTNCKTINYQK